ncbi:MAG: AAA family ATPase [candidate division NC10 bacterium]|nr:AAA family ATPase [candidate division NC10 bacterium]
MQCPRCRHDNPAGVKFCGECGTRLASRCAACGASNPPTNKFCGECGASLTPAAAAPKFASPETYTPKHLAEKILTSKSALEGERKQVTVLFADVKGSMELLADRDPEEARKLLDPVLEHMMEAVHRYEGTVNQVMGDGIMALFGAPLAHEDHAVRACYAALRIQESVKRYAEEVRRTEGIPVQIRVGLNSGEVVVRSIGSDLHMDYTAVGQTTHLAARMEQIAMPGSILMSAATLRLAEGYVQVKPFGPIPVKGLSEPVEVYEITGATTLRTRLQAAAARGLTRFVGREAELEALRQALERARNGRGQVVALVGEPGVGKSRLVWEFTRSYRTHGWLILETGSASYGKATPYLPVLDLLKAYFDLEARDDGRKIREKVTGKLLTLDAALQPTLPAFLALLDVPVEDTGWQALDPVQRRHRTLEALKRLLLRESQVQPLLLVFEDLHWIDSETQALLDSLVESLPTARHLLLLNYRPEYQHGWGSKTYYTQLRLDPLPPASTEELLQALLGADGALASLKQLLVNRTEGNPFFLEESVQTLVETQVLVGERGAYRLAKALPAIQVPATVQAVLAARIDRLPPEEKRLLQAAAVIGEDVPLPLLQAVAEGPEEALRLRLAHLQAAEFLYETSLFPDLAYTFKHGLTYQVAYQSLLQDRRRALHAQIVEALERLYPDRLTEQVDRLAHHAFRGEVWNKAVAYLRQAGTNAMARSANREAATCFEQAVVALSHLPETRETLGQAIDLRIDLRNPLWALGELGRLFEHLQGAEGLARMLDDPRRLGWVSVYMSASLWSTGHSTEARPFVERAWAMAETLGDFALQIAANFYLGTTSVTSGDYRRAEDFFQKIVQSLEGDLNRERFGLAGSAAVLSHSWLAWSLAERGEFDEGIAHGQEGIRIAEALDHPFSMAHIWYDLGYLYGVKGELSHAVHLLERAVALSRNWNLTYLSPVAMGFLGHVYALSGRVAEGLPLLHEAIKGHESIGLAFLHSLLIAQLGEACVLADRREDAVANAGRALTLARQRGQRGYEAYALRLLGEIAAHQDPPDIEKAEASYRQAMALAVELGMRPLVAYCHLGLGTLYSQMRKPEQARSKLATAVELFRSMDMTFWLKRAEAALAKTH